MPRERFASLREEIFHPLKLTRSDTAMNVNIVGGELLPAAVGLTENDDDLLDEVMNGG